MTGRLGLARVVTRTFDDAKAYSPELAGFLSDLSRLHGLPQREDYFARATRTTFTDMAQAIAAELADRIEPFGLAVVAHSTPDAEPGWPASYLSGALPGEPLAFAVADQGAAAPFTALRVAIDFAADDQTSAEGRHATLVLCMDQTAVIPDRRPPPGTVRPGQNRAIALVLEPDGQLATLSVRQLTDVGPADAIAAVEAELRARTGQATVVMGPATVALGPALTEADRIVRAPAFLPGTGLWHELARLLREPRVDGGWILLVSYDEPLGYLDLCSVGAA